MSATTLEHADRVLRAQRHGWQVDATSFHGTYMVLVTDHGVFFCLIGW